MPAVSQTSLGDFAIKFEVDLADLIAKNRRVGAVLRTFGPAGVEFDQQVERFMLVLAEELRAGMRSTLGTSLDDLRKRTGFRFQTVPSYIYESNVLKLPGRKPYPPDTIGTFSVDAPSIAGTAWEQQLQQYIDGSHPIRDLLRVSVRRSGTKIVGEVGYPRNLPGHIKDILIYTLFGTDKEQPRPFLQREFQRLVKTQALPRLTTQAISRALQKTRQ